MDHTEAMKLQAQVAALRRALEKIAKDNVEEDEEGGDVCQWCWHGRMVNDPTVLHHADDCPTAIAQAIPRDTTAAAQAFENRVREEEREACVEEALNHMMTFGRGGSPFACPVCCRAGEHEEWCRIGTLPAAIRARGKAGSGEAAKCEDKEKAR